MNQRKNLLVFLVLSALLASILACDSANPVAPMGTVLTVSASPTQIGVNGSSTITVTGFKPDGNPLNPGTQITVNTDLGTLDSTVIQSNGSGFATTTLRSDGRIGSATVTAGLTTGGESSAMVLVQIGEDPNTQPMLAITASPNVIALGESARVSVLARAADGSLFGSGGQVELRTDLGFFSSSSSCSGSRNNSVTLTTGANSEASTTLCASNQPGTATITGSIGSSPEVMATVTIENQRPVLQISANPSIVPTTSTSTITIIARDDQGIPLGSGNRIRLTADLGDVPSEVFTDSNGEAVAIYVAGNRGGTGQVTAILGSSEPVTVMITVRSALDSVDLIANPQTIQRDDNGVMINLRVTVLDSQGLPIPSVLVRFDTLGNVDNNPVPTNAQGVAVATLTVRRIDVQNIPENGTFTITATATSEGITRQDTQDITVLGQP